MREYTLIHFEKVKSTNELVMNLLEGAELPIAVAAEEQTGGRGRYGRRWYSPKGGLYISIGDRNPGIPAKRYLLSVLPVLEVVKELASIEVFARFPNDLIYWNKKLGGVLVETKGEFVVVGIGLNVNIEEFPEELNATSLFLITGKRFEIDEIVNLLLTKYEAFLQELQKDYEGLFKRYRDKLLDLGAEVLVEGRDGEYRGVLVDVDEELNPTIRTREGTFTIKFEDLIRLEVV